MRKILRWVGRIVGLVMLLVVQMGAIAYTIGFGPTMIYNSNPCANRSFFTTDHLLPLLALGFGVGSIFLLRAFLSRHWPDVSPRTRLILSIVLGLFILAFAFWVPSMFGRSLVGCGVRPAI